MNQKPPVPEELLLDYASGACSPALGLLVATHVSMSEESRKLYHVLEEVGGAFIETLQDEKLERVTAQSVLDLADNAEGNESLDLAVGTKFDVSFDADPPNSTRFGGEAPPFPLQIYASEYSNEKAWSRLGRSVAAMQLSASNDEERAHLLWAKPRAHIATHRHVGREVVLVLKGAFWDGDVRYGPGDIAVGEDGSVHTPAIADEGECVCLAVTEAPVHFVGSFGWLLNRYCRF